MGRRETDPHHLTPVQELEITGLNNTGEGIARMPDGRICFVTGALPGELVRARIVTEKKDYLRLKAFRILVASAQRISPRCPWFDRCGGCQLQHMSYTTQLEFKKNAVEETLERTGKLSGQIPIIEGCHPSPSEWGYRNKAAFPVVPSQKGPITGFYQQGSHRIVPIDECPIIDPELELAFRILRTRLQHIGLPPYDEKTHRGQLKHIVLRKGIYSGEGLFALILRDFPPKPTFPRIHSLLAQVRSKVPSLQNGVININPDRGNFIWGNRDYVFEGNGYHCEHLDTFSYRLAPSAFFQVNTPQALNLYNHAVREASKEIDRGRCLELFSGTGSLTHFLAKEFQDLSAVESWHASVKALNGNLRTNGLDHVRVYAETAEDFMVHRHSDEFEVIVLDPPRSGCKPPVLEGITRISPRKVIYISCNPATLARDLRILTMEGNFQIQRIVTFDMFPQTYHVETVVTLHRRS